MGDGQNGDLRLDFDRRLQLKFLRSQVTTDRGLQLFAPHLDHSRAMNSW